MDNENPNPNPEEQQADVNETLRVFGRRLKVIEDKAESASKEELSKLSSDFRELSEKVSQFAQSSAVQGLEAKFRDELKKLTDEVRSIGGELLGRREQAQRTQSGNNPPTPKKDGGVTLLDMD